MCHFQLRYIIVLTEWKKYNIITYHQVFAVSFLCGSAEMETQHGSHSGRLDTQQQQQFDQSSCIRVHGAGPVHNLHPTPLASWLPSNHYCAGRGHLAKSFCTLQLGIASLTMCILQWILTCNTKPFTIWAHPHRSTKFCFPRLTCFQSSNLCGFLTKQTSHLPPPMSLCIFLSAFSPSI